MDSIIPLGQKNTLAEYMILSGADNRPPMLDKDLYDSWKSRMELYMQNRVHERMILESVKNGPLIWPIIEENGVTKTKKYAELSAAEKIQADCDMKATNIILQGLPADIYSLMNHHRVAKDLWERVQLLMQGTSLTKQERECKLYDAFDKFTHIKGESLHKYYLRFTQLINDMNIYNMKMEQFQVNTKFLNSLPPEWSKFVTDVKLVKDLHTTNFDQLHAYLEQHELHANEVRLLRERNQDPLAFVANQQMTPPHFNTYQSSYNNPQLQQQFPPSQYGSIHPTQHYSSTYPSQPQFNHSSVPPSYPYQSQMNHQTSSVPQIAYQSPQVSTQPMTESPLVDSGFAVPVFSPGDDPIACLNKAMAFLTVVASSSTGYKSNATSSGGNNASGQAKVVKCYNCQGEGHMARQCTQPKRPRNAAWYKEKAMLAEAQEAGQILDEEQLAFLADPGVPDGQAVQTIIPNNAAFQTEDLDTYDSDCDDISNVKAVLMANISNYGSDVISEVPHSKTYLNDMENQSVHAIQDFEKPPTVDFIDNEIHSDSNIIPHSQYLQETQHANVQDTHLQAQQDSMILSVIEQMSEQMINHKKRVDKKCLKKKRIHKPIEYEKLNRLSDDFGKRFTPQQELSAEQAFWLRMSNPTNKPSDASPVKIEAPKEFPKVSLVNNSLKRLKFHLARFDNVVKIKTTPDALTKGEWGFGHTKAVFNNEIIPFLKSLKDIFKVFDRDILNEIMEVKTVFDQMDATVQQSSVDKQCLEIAKKELLLENDRLLQQIMSQEVLLTVMNSMSLIGESVNMDGKRKESCNLEAELWKSQNAFNDL
ncbi:retrovirus-related pol polyprotein from transposon TNT 1-94 [Tanacetum coccineum]